MFDLEQHQVLVGDETMSVLEIWGAEYQENNALLIKPESTELFLAMASRENCPASLLGKVSGDGRVTVKDSRDGTVPYDLPLKVKRGLDLAESRRAFYMRQYRAEAGRSVRDVGSWSHALVRWLLVMVGFPCVSRYL